MSKTGIIICTFNRPHYLRECFDSLLRADLSNCKIFIVDDGSTDGNTNRMIRDFKPPCEVVIIRKPRRKGIKDSLLTGFQIAFEECELVMNLDSDAVVRNDFVKVLLSLKKKLPSRIITGFNSLTKNRDGSDRHIVTKTGKGYNMKVSVGGINMILDKTVYVKYVLPALLEPTGNWDHLSCINAGGAVCSVPSVVQHIGVNSSMGHFEPMDVADDFIPVSLPSVTLIGVDNKDPERLMRAAEISSKHILFGKTVLLTTVKITSKEEYSRFVLKELVNYINTDYFLIIQHDGYVLNWKGWTNEYFNYDYIGAVWNWHRDNHRVGNGGFSLRSKRLHEILRDDPKIILNNDGVCSNFEEDHNIARVYRKYLELNYDIKFAPETLAKKFSIEGFGNPDRKYRGEFGFHGESVDFHGAQLEHIPYLIKRHDIRHHARQGLRNFR